MNIYFQFLTHNQTVEAIHMLRLVNVLTDSAALKGRVKISAQAMVSHSTFSDIETLCAKMATRRFNQLEVLPDPLQARLGGVDINITSINGVFYPSLTGALWLPTKKWRTNGGRSSDNKYMTAKSREDRLKFYHAKTVPSVFEIVVKTSSKVNKDVILLECSKWLAKSLPDSLGELQLFGCCDVGGAELAVALEAGVLSTDLVRIMAKVKPSAYRELGERFESLHPVMFGSKKLCEGISEALGKEAKLTAAIHVKDLAVICLVSKCDMESARSRAADWLINGADKK